MKNIAIITYVALCVLVAVTLFSSCKKGSITPLNPVIINNGGQQQLAPGAYTATQVANQTPTIADNNAANAYFNQPNGYQGPGTPVDIISGWGPDRNWRIVIGIILDIYGTSISAAANRGDAEYFLTAMPLGTNPSNNNPVVRLTIQAYNRLIAEYAGMATNAAVTGYEVFQFRKASEDEDADGNAFTSYEYSGLLLKYEHPVTKDADGYITTIDTTVQILTYYDKAGSFVKEETYSRNATDTARYYRTPAQLENIGKAVLKAAKEQN